MPWQHLVSPFLHVCPFKNHISALFTCIGFLRLYQKWDHQLLAVLMVRWALDMDKIVVDSLWAGIWKGIKATFAINSRQIGHWFNFIFPWLLLALRLEGRKIAPYAVDCLVVHPFWYSVIKHICLILNKSFDLTEHHTCLSLGCLKEGDWLRIFHAAVEEKNNCDKNVHLQTL